MMSKMGSAEINEPVTANVPALRFGEFEGEWEEKRLDEISNVERGKFTPRPRNDPRYYGGDTPFVQTGDIVKSGVYLENYIQTLNDEGVGVSRIFPSNTILISIAANIGDVAIVTFPVACPDSLVGIVTGDSCDHIWLFHWLSMQKTTLISYATTNAQANINLAILRPLKVCIPSLSEQQKIANFLSAVDSKLNTLEKTHAALNRYKRGLMQQLFSQTSRFKDDNGQDFPDWEEKRLGELGVFIGGGTPSTNEKQYWYGDIPWVSSSDIEENSVDKVSITRFINELAISDSATKIVPAGSILIVSRVGVGKLAVSLDKVCTSQDFANFTPDKDNVYFLAYFLLFHKNKLLSFSQGTSIKGFTTDDIACFKIGLPCPKEQQKIAQTLSTLDNKITAAATQITQLKTFKKGLLQQMFV